MVLALLTIIRPLQVPPVWSVQKAAADRIETRKSNLRLVPRDTADRAQPRQFL
ncbi:MAG TPA: hypothetical protein VGO52_02245 [Hyphomonadaceae bacterium]|jgi:hypothetical protein|nr:hypothetical protein [Hyphomonadaceae bacterium]